MSNEGQGHFLTLFFQVLYILCLNEAQISDERLQDHWSSGFVGFHRDDGPSCCNYSIDVFLMDTKLGQSWFSSPGSA